MRSDVTIELNHSYFDSTTCTMPVIFVSHAKTNSRFWFEIFLRLFSAFAMAPRALPRFAPIRFPSRRRRPPFRPLTLPLLALALARPLVPVRPQVPRPPMLRQQLSVPVAMVLTLFHR